MAKTSRNFVIIENFLLLQKESQGKEALEENTEETEREAQFVWKSFLK